MQQSGEAEGSEVVSCELTAQVLELEVEPTTKLVLLMVSDHAHVADGQHLYRPDTSRLSWLTRVPEAKVREILARLETTGVLAESSGGFYLVNLDSLPKLGRFAGARKRRGGR